MNKDQSFHDHVVRDLFVHIPDITSRAMFGGWGLYQDGVIFGIIADGELYFKVDDTNRAGFERLALRSQHWWPGVPLSLASAALFGASTTATPLPGCRDRETNDGNGGRPFRPGFVSGRRP